MPIRICLRAGLAAAALAIACVANAQDPDSPFLTQRPPSPLETDRAPTHGHSILGEAFNEGPRQHAYLMKGMGKVSFPITTTSEEAQKFFNQGIAQLHGFWYFESERSFRQAAMLDPGSPMPYWGMCMSNVGNAARAKEFIKKAREMAVKSSLASPRERMYIDAWVEYYKDGSIDKARKRSLVKTLEAITKKYPDDIEAKAFMCLFIWEHSFDGIPIFNYETLDSLMNQVLAKNPLHPIHHYRIHLWNGRKDENALNSAARGGPSEPGIAHMWHMPGHTYSSLKRYADAAWQQEASARVDHGHMMRDWVLPDQIHNYAHNNQWLVEDLIYIGRVRDAVDLAKNMVELPRNPKYNTVGGFGSAGQGRRRLFQVLTEYELWDELIALAGTPYLEPTGIQDQKLKRISSLGVAWFSKGDAAKGREQIAALEAMLRMTRETKATGQSAAACLKPGEKKLSDFQVKQVEAALDELKGYAALAAGKTTEAKALFDHVDYIPKDRRARLYLALGDKAKAEELAREAARIQPNQVQPQANLVETLYACGKRDDARAEFKKLQEISGSIDMEAPVFQRLTTIAQDLSLSADWRVRQSPSADVGWRPRLESLGPFRWQPSPAPRWTLRDTNGRRVSLEDYTKAGKPVLLVFYLGSGCAQCMEQLNLFAPAAKEFKDSGISILAVGTESKSGLKLTGANSKEHGGFPFPLLSDYDMRVFKAYHAYDDFEKMPLHGTFLIDGKGKVRWQDISYQPFKETGFLLEEAKRLLKQDSIAPVTALTSVHAVESR